MDTKPIMTAVDRNDCEDISPGFFITHHVLNLLIALRSLDTESKMAQPLYVNQSGTWLEETEAKRVFRRVIKEALTLRDGKPPPPECLNKFTLYSNKVGKKVHLDYSKTSLERKPDLSEDGQPQGEMRITLDNFRHR